MFRFKIYIQCTTPVWKAMLQFWFQMNISLQQSSWILLFTYFMYGDCMLSNTPTKHSKYVVNQKLKTFNDINFREIFRRIRGCFFLTKSDSSLSKLARSFNFTFRFIDDVLSLNNCKFGDFVDRIFPIGLEIKDTTDTARSA
jgi:hypothetical protein